MCSGGTWWSPIMGGGAGGGVMCGVMVVHCK